jgi:hypothetical protein
MLPCVVRYRIAMSMHGQWWLRARGAPQHGSQEVIFEVSISRLMPAAMIA